MKNTNSDAQPHKRGRGRPRLKPQERQEPSTVQALERGLNLLQILARSGSASLSDLSLQIGLPASTAYRMLNTLQKLQFVSFDETTQEWAVGIESYTVGSSYFNRTNLTEASRKVMRQLMLDTGETANLAILSDTGLVTFLTQMESTNPIRAFHIPGTSSHAHSSGIGKALLAEMPRSQVEDVLQKTGLKEFTPNTITTPKSLFEDLANIHVRGWSLDDEERHIGMRCIASAVHNEMGDAIAGLSISGPTARFTDDQLAVMGPTVRVAAMEITRMIGGNAPDYGARLQALN